MRVDVHDEVFGPGSSAKLIRALIGFAESGRHRIILIDRGGPHLAAFLARSSATDREDYLLAFSDSEQAENLERSAHALTVGAGASALTLEQAIPRLSRPFALIMENTHSDRAFLEAVATPEHRRALRHSYERGWLTFRASDGTSGIREMIQRELAEFQGDQTRLFALFDSDAREPDQPSSEALKNVRACQDYDVCHRMLKRLAIENYLTRYALHAWAAGQANEAAHRLRAQVLYDAWFEEDPRRRHHLHMKEGFSKSPRARIHERVPKAIEKALAPGWPKDVAVAFRPEWMLEAHLREEGAWEELSEIVSTLVSCLR